MVILTELTAHRVRVWGSCVDGTKEKILNRSTNIFQPPFHGKITSACRSCYKSRDKSRINGNITNGSALSSCKQFG